MPETILYASRKIRLFIGLPAYGARIDMQQARTWLSLGFALASNDAGWTLRGFEPADICGVDVARNELIRRAIQACMETPPETPPADGKAPDPFGGEAAWCLMLDADTWHDNDLEGGYDILAMIREGERRNAGVIAAPTPRRAPGETRYMVYNGKIEGVGDLLRPVPKEEFNGRIIEVESIATSLFAINLRAVLTTPPPWFDFRYTREGSLDRQGEDIYCCEKLRARGWKILCDGRFTTEHRDRGRVLK